MNTDDGSRLRLKILYAIIILMGIVMFFETIALMGYGSSIDYINSNMPRQYSIDSMQSSINQIQNQLQYEVPAKWEFDNMGTRLSSLENRMNNCKCW